jgi:hypothetical protein
MKFISRSVLVVVVMAGWLNLRLATAQGLPSVLTLVSETHGTNFDDGTLRGYTDIQLVGNYAYLAWMGYSNTNHPGGLEILDASNAARPSRLGRRDGRAEANAIRVSGHYAYLAGGTERTRTNDTGWLEIFDVSDPANPARIGGIETPGRGLDVQVVGNFAYVAQSVRWTGSNLLGALGVFDVGTPTNPIRLATYDTAGSASSVEISGGYAYLADGVADLEVLDVSNPAAPRRVGGYDTDEWRNHGGYEHGGAAVHVQVAGDLVYSSGQDGLHVLNVTNPQVPVRIGGYNGLPFDFAFQVSGRYAGVSFWYSHLNRFALFLLDVSSPANPTWLATTETPGWPMSMQFSGPFMHVAAGPLLIYEIADAPALRLITNNGKTLALSWDAPPGFRLQRASSLDDPVWCNVPGTLDQSQIELPVGKSNGFFRLARP